MFEPRARTNHRELSLMPLSTARMMRTPREERHSRRRGSFALSAGGGSASSRVAEETAVPGGGLHHRAIATSANLAMSSVCFSFFSEATVPQGKAAPRLSSSSSSSSPPAPAMVSSVSAVSNCRSHDVTRRHESICRVIFTRSGSCRG